MRSTHCWEDRIPPRIDQPNTVWSLAWKPDGTQIVAAVSNRVLVYDPTDGELIHSLKGHKDTVYCVEYSRDGTRFASGGADCTVFIWTSEGEPLVKYSHNDTIQALAYNPISQQLVSCTANDFGLWSPEQKSVQKHRVSSRINCASWSPDGQYLALGMMDGQVQIRDRNGQEKVIIQRNEPIWSISWNPSRDEPVPILAVGCWDQTLSFYQVSGLQHGKDRQLDFDPTSVNYTSGGDYILVGGSNKKALLFSRDGIEIGLIAQREDWVWTVRPQPKQNYVAIATNDGVIGVYHMVFSTVHGLYQDRYAYRDALMTDVIVQHLITEQKVRIKCRDLVKKIAVYKDRLAVQLKEKVIVYELAHPEDPFDMHYRVRQRIQKALDCNLLVVTSQHVILCLEKKLQLFGFSGIKEREWILEAVIRYIKVVGGPPGKEGVLVGLKNGVVLKIFVDNPFPVQMIKHTSTIRCLDLSMNRQKLAVVDENANVLVYDVDSNELLWQESGANSVAWNTQAEDMLCFSGSNQLSIKTGTFPLHRQKLQGFVVGFNGSKIFCLHSIAMQTIDVPQSASLYRYIDIKDWDMAYRIACLGVTEADWRVLAMSALKAMQLGIARKAFIRVRDTRYIELLNHIENEKIAGRGDDTLFLGEVFAYENKYKDAARMFERASEVGGIEKAIDMFTDLRLWDAARRFAEKSKSINIRDLMLKQASACEDSGDYKGAATIYHGLDMSAKAIALYGEHGDLNEIAEIVRNLDASGEQRSALQEAAKFFRAAGREGAKFAKETYLRLGDVDSLLDVHIDNGEWEEAISLATSADKSEEKKRRETANTAGLDKNALQTLGKANTYTARVYLPYAEHLALHDKYEEAQIAYEKAGRPDLSSAILQALTISSVRQNQHTVASALYRRLARGVLYEGQRKAREVMMTARYQAKLQSMQSNTESDDDQSITSTPRYNQDPEDPMIQRTLSISSMTQNQSQKQSQKQSHGLSTEAARSLARRIRVDAEDRFHAFCHLADLHYAYSRVQQFVDAPFTPTAPEVLFHTSAYVMNGIISAFSSHGTDSTDSTFEEGKETDDMDVLEEKLGDEGDWDESTIRKEKTSKKSPLFILQTKPLWTRLPTILFSGEANRKSHTSKNALMKRPTLGLDTSNHSSILLNTASNNVGITKTGVPYGISSAKCLYTLGRQGTELGAFKLARAAFERLAALLYPQAWRNSIELARLTLQARPFSDSETVLPACYRCGSVNSVLRANGVGDACSNCGHLFVRCMVTFDVLPLVEFSPDFKHDTELSSSEALRLLASDPTLTHTDSTAHMGHNNSDGWQENHHEGNVQTLTFDTSQSNEKPQPSRHTDETLTFDQMLGDVDAIQFGTTLTVPRSILQQLNPSEIFVRRWDEIEPILQCQYYKNLLPEVHIASCRNCWHFFHAEELELAVLKTSKCPVCEGDAETYIVWQ